MISAVYFSCCERWWSTIYYGVWYLNICLTFCTGLDMDSIEKCMGDPDADSENPVLKEEQQAQVYIPSEWKHSTFKTNV